MANKTKVYLSRDLSGNVNDRIFFWNQKPMWDQKEHYYECPNKNCDHCVVATISPTCDDFSNILKAFGIENGTIKRGQLVEFTTTAIISQGETQEGIAQDLIKRLKSNKKPTQKELIKFLTEVGVEIDNDEADNDDDDEDYSTRECDPGYGN